MRQSVLISAFVALAACQPKTGTGTGSPTPRPAQPPEQQAQCGADDLQYLVGQPAGVFDFDALDQRVRILPPGAMMTMDYRIDRLNVDLDGKDRITRIWCG